MELIAQHLCMTKDIGIHGNLFGGVMLSWLDEAAAAMASRISYSPNVVTVKMDEVSFRKPVKVGYQIRIYGEVHNIGNTSLTLYVEARKYNVYSGLEDVVTHTEITFVRIDESGDPVPLPDSVKEKYKNVGK